MSSAAILDSDYVMIFLRWQEHANIFITTDIIRTNSVLFTIDCLCDGKNKEKQVAVAYFFDRLQEITKRSINFLIMQSHGTCML
jgi:hypothetical protein